MASPPVRYVELHCKTNFSFLEGASHPDELVAQSAKLGYAGMAVTDRNSLAGAVRAHVAAKEAGLKLIVGSEVSLVDASPILLWAMNREGYGRLCQLLTRGRRQAPKGECRLSVRGCRRARKWLVIGVLLPPAGDLSWELADGANSFRDRTYAVAELHRGLGDERRLNAWQRAACTRSVPLVAAGDVHYHDARRRYLQDVLTAIRLKTTVAELGASSLSQRRTTAEVARRDSSLVRPVSGRRLADRRSVRPLYVLTR